MAALFSLGVFLTPIQESMAWGRSEISSVALVTWSALGVGSFVWGLLSDRWGSRAVVVSSGLLLGLGLVLSSQVQALWQFYAAFGVVVGLAVGGFYAPLTSTATKWFRANRGLAVALVSAGSGLGTFVVAPLVRWLIGLYGWRTAMLLLGDCVWLVIVPFGLLVRNAPGDVGAVAMGDVRGHRERDFSLREVGRTPQFWLIAATHFTCCAAHSGPIFHMVAHATDQGVGAMAAATVLGVSGLASVAGRIASGLLADRLGARATLVGLLAVQSPAILLYLLTRDALGFYMLSLLFGAAYGGVMPLYALLTREYFGARAMGGAYGAVFMLQAIGMGLGSFAGGWFYDRLGSYAWFFAGAAVLAAAAVLLAWTLRPPRPVPPALPGSTISAPPLGVPSSG